MSEDYASLCTVLTLQSEKRGFFQNFVFDVDTVVDEAWLEDFRLSKSNEERILKCYEGRAGDVVRRTLRNIREIFRGKSAWLSQQRRQEGEQLFNEGKLQRAFLLFTQSVTRAPASGKDPSVDDGHTLSYALYGRSAVLFQMQKYELCLVDLKLCLAEKLPQEMKLNAYWRMSKCYVHLREPEKALVSLNVLDKMCERDEFATVARLWKNKVKIKMEVLMKTVRPTEKEMTTVKPRETGTEDELTGGENGELPAASKLLKLSADQKRGRFIVAAGTISIGDTLVVEDPYVVCLLPEKCGSHCHHCFQKLEYAISCPDCSAVAFCGVPCRNAACSTYHKYECRYVDLMIGSGMSVLCFCALRIVTQNKLEYFAEAAGGEGGKGVDFDFDEIQTSHPYSRIYSLETHRNERSPADFLHRTLMALFLLKILSKSGYFPSEENEEEHLSRDRLLMARILLRNLEVLQFNAHEIFETIRCKPSDKVNYIGVALYKTASYFNHECYPAVARYFNGKKIILKALRPLEENEIVSENYGEIFTSHSLVERRNKLSARYWFRCECRACLEDWPLLENMDREKFKCENCSNIFCNEKNCGCGMELDEEVCKKKLLLLRKKYEEGVKMFDKDTVGAAKMFVDFINSARKLCADPNRDICNAEFMLRKCWNTWGNCRSL